MEAVSLFKEAVISCISGSAANEGIIEQDEDFSKRAGFYWRVVRPLDQCLALLAKDMHLPDDELEGLALGRGFTDVSSLGNRY